MFCDMGINENVSKTQTNKTTTNNFDYKIDMQKTAQNTSLNFIKNDRKQHHKTVNFWNLKKYKK